MVEKAWGSGKSDGKRSAGVPVDSVQGRDIGGKRHDLPHHGKEARVAGKTVPGYKYAKLPDVELYPVCGGYPVYGHSEVWIAVSKEDK